MLILSGKDSQKYEIFKILFKGGIIIMPCDTIYGLVGIAPESEERLNKIKGRAPEKNYLQLILKEWLPQFSSAVIDPDLLSICPGKLTFVVKNDTGKTTAIRFPRDPLLVYLLKALNRPLYSTSVNRSGENNLYKSDDIKREFTEDVDAFIDRGDIPGRKPSTILDVTVRPYTVLRPGACNIPDKFLI